jgi:hypothetical protein
MRARICADPGIHMHAFALDMTLGDHMEAEDMDKSSLSYGTPTND